MPVVKGRLRSKIGSEIVRYTINGLLATVVHFGVLTFNLQFLEMRSAGLASFVAAIFGISASFIGNHIFVFKQRSKSFTNQAIRFATVYASIAILHGIVLFAWTDVYGLDYRVGFVIATTLQVALSYALNKFLVFQ